MEKNNLSGLSPLWLISLAMVLGTMIVTMLPVAINGGEAIKASDWISFAGNVLAGVMTLIAAAFAWLSVQKQIVIQQQIATDLQNAVLDDKNRQARALALLIEQEVHNFTYVLNIIVSSGELQRPIKAPTILWTRINDLWLLGNSGGFLVSMLSILNVANDHFERMFERPRTATEKAEINSGIVENLRIAAQNCEDAYAHLKMLLGHD